MFKASALFEIHITFKKVCLFSYSRFLSQSNPD